MLLESWDKYLAGFPQERTDIYFREQYARSQASQKDRLLAFVHQEDAQCLVCPLLIREVPGFRGTCWDAETPYGYGGPAINSTDPDFWGRAVERMSKELAEMGVIAAFFRFHPLLANQGVLDKAPGFEAMRQRESVVLDLGVSEDCFWNEHIHSKHRNAIRQAQKAGLRFIVDDQWRFADEFSRLYAATMARVEADEYYFFGRDYFEEMKKLAPDAFLGVVLKDDRCVAAAIFMRQGPYAHYHLSASDAEAQPLRPNNLLIFEAARHLKKEGARWLHLGGASDSPRGASLFQFKARFSLERRDFFIGKWVLNSAVYEQVCRAWENENPDKIDRYGRFFLKYRY